MAGSEHGATFARALRAERERRGMSRRELALASGVSERSLINYEKSLNEPPLGQAAKLAAALGMSLDEMLSGRATAPPDAGEPDARRLLEESIRLQQIALLNLEDA